jgi:hypothetical protein
MKYQNHVYCISCGGLFDATEDEHAREEHGSPYARLPNVSSISDDHYVAIYDSLCVIACNFKDLGNGVETCASCHAVKVPHDVANPLEEEDHLQ